MAEINFLDLIILVVFLFFVYNGFQRGFIDQTSTILGLFIALIVAVNQYELFQVYLEPYFDLSPSLMQFLSFAIIFVIVNVVIHIIGIVTKNIVDAIFLKPLDRVAGAFLGLVKAGILAYLLVLIMAQIPYQKVVNVLDKSFLSGYLLDLTPLIQENLQNFFRP